MIIPEDDGTETENPTPTVIPAGPQICEVAGAFEKVSAAGRPYYNLKLRVIEGQFKNRVVFGMLFADGDWKPQFRNACAAFGVSYAPGQDLPAETFIGKKAIVTLKVETYQGQQRTKPGFDAYAPYDDTPVPPGTEESLAF